MSDQSADQLVSFFVYSLFIYPVTNYIVAPQRKYPRWKAALYAIVFLVTVATLHLLYENSEAGPNHFQLLNITRDTPISALKKSFRSLSLEYHPDKNSAQDATEKFRKIQYAYEVLVDRDKRREYNRLGDHGVKYAAQSVVDVKYLLLQMIVYYFSSLIFAFLMTFSEPTGDAFQLSVLGLLVMALVEVVLIVHEQSLPSWFFPSNTAHDIVSTMHRLFPAFMNGGRSITGAFFHDRKAARVASLELLSNATKDVTMRCTNIVRLSEDWIQAKTAVEFGDDLDEEDNDNSDQQPGEEKGEEQGEGADQVAAEPKIHYRKPKNVAEQGMMAAALHDVRKRVASTKEGRDGLYEKLMAERMRLISNAKTLASSGATCSAERWLLFRNFVIYIIARYVLIKSPQ